MPLRSGQTGGRGVKKLIVYSDDNFVGCAGWLCCASVCVHPLPFHCMIGGRLGV